MPVKNNIPADVLDKWNQLLLREMDSLPAFQLSALSSWVKDCEDSFNEVYSNLLVQIANSPPDDFETLHNSVVDIYWHLDHIKNHILDAEEGLTALMETLAAKT